VHTQVYPERLEAGTINIAGIFGLSAGLGYISRHGAEKIHAKELGLAKRLHDGLTSIRGVQVYPATLHDPWVPIMLCNVDGMDPEDLASILDGDFGIAARAGLHCAPLVHEDLGTSPKGGVRFSLGPFNTEEDIDKVLEAMARISHAR
jgi:selenocysteine lyase/cysteine desulfurase